MPPRKRPVVLRRGIPPERARAALILVHGRGSSAGSILGLADQLDTAGFALLAPEAEGGSWYPVSFLAPLQENEPAIGDGIDLLAQIAASAAAAGLPYERIGLLGFSQGACLALEFAARRARRFGGVFGLSGGLIGPPGTPRDYGGSLGGTPVFLGCGDADPHIPVERVIETSDVLALLGGLVTLQIYPGMGHRVNGDEIARVNAGLARLRDGG